METDTLIDFSTLEGVLEEYGTEVCERYRAELAEQGKNASGVLSGSVRYIVKKETTVYAVDLSLAEYWKYVEYGRRPGKFPPPDKILEWIRVKPVLPRPMENGKLPTDQQLAYLIGRKIARDGIKPTPALADASTDVFDRFLARIGEAITDDLARAVDGVLAGLAS